MFVNAVASAAATAADAHIVAVAVRGFVCGILDAFLTQRFSIAAAGAAATVVGSKILFRCACATASSDCHVNIHGHDGIVILVLIAVARLAQLLLAFLLLTSLAWFGLFAFR